MVVEASVSGLLRTVLLIIGAIVALRFIGQLMNAKRNIDEERRLNAERDAFEKELRRTKADIGKTSILKNFDSPSQKTARPNVEDVEYEEI